MVGYLGYDTVRFFERLPDKNPDELKFEDALFILADTILIFDHINHTIKIVSCAILPSGSRISSRASLRHYQQAVSRIETIHTSLKRPLQEAGLPQRPLRPLSVTSNFKKEEFCAIVGRAKKYIRAGDIIQVVLSQRLKVRLRRQPFDIYRRLRSLNPSPYMFFLQLKGLFLVGSSPEVHLRCENRRALIRPIAGTRPRGRTPEEDERLARELLRDGKEKAEHLMLVDLARNDLGRTCEKGGVTVSEFMGIERYSHVMHLVSEVTGVLRKGQDSYDCLRQSFPAGTVSGSPKVRAMEIIDELENTRRSAYAGCVGYFSFSGNTDTCIAIRTIVIKGNYGYIQAGAGIVADSRQQREYQETLNKARALLEAV
jgi:anthranilate synthase component 1